MLENLARRLPHAVFGRGAFTSCRYTLETLALASRDKLLDRLRSFAVRMQTQMRPHRHFVGATLS